MPNRLSGFTYEHLAFRQTSLNLYVASQRHFTRVGVVDKVLSGEPKQRFAFFVVVDGFADSLSSRLGLVFVKGYDVNEQLPSFSPFPP